MLHKKIIEIINKYIEDNNSNLEELAKKANTTTDNLLHLNKSFEIIEKIFEIIEFPIDNILKNDDDDASLIREFGKNMNNNFARGSIQNFIINRKDTEKNKDNEIQRLKNKIILLSEQNTELLKILDEKNILIEHISLHKKKKSKKSPLYFFQFIINQIITHMNISH